MASWSKQATALSGVAVSLILGFGIAFLIGGNFLTALAPANGANASVSYNITNSVLQSFVSPIKTILPIVVLVAFVMLLYIMARQFGLIDGNKKGER